MCLIFGRIGLPGPTEILIVVVIVLLLLNGWNDRLWYPGMQQDRTLQRRWLGRQRCVHREMVEAKRPYRGSASRGSTIAIIVLCVLLFVILGGRLMRWW